MTATTKGSAKSGQGTGSAENKLRIKLVRSPIGYAERQKRTVQALGLRRIDEVVEQNDTPVIRGMLAKVSHLVAVEESK
jgi:large subunit ribosomal protein L30